MRLALLAIAASCLWAQTPDIHGTVFELGPNTPLAGVQVTLTGFVPANDTLEERSLATVFTDDRGRFALKPPALGEYRVDVSKPGYVAEDRNVKKVFAILTAERPSQEYRFSLLNPSGMQGQFLDEKDRPISGLTIFLQPLRGMLSGPPRNISTDSQGNFSVQGIPPGEYLVRAGFRSEFSRTPTDYSDAEFDKVDRHFLDAFWPGGVTEERDALPVLVPSGGTANLGILRVPEATYYRVHVHIEGNCTGEWKYSLIPMPQRPNIVNFSNQPLACKPDLLLQNIAPGSYQLAVWRSDSRVQWAISPFVVTNRNVDLTLHLSPPIDVAGKFVAAEGSKLPDRLTASINVMRPETRAQETVSIGMVMLRPEITGLEMVGANNARTAPDGGFAYRGLLWTQYQVSLMRLPPTHYVREIRYGGVVSPDGRISLVPGATLEIELDEQPATISGTVEGGGAQTMIYLVRTGVDMPRFTEVNAPFSYLSPLENGPSFSFPGLSPGEYRLVAVPADSFMPTTAGLRSLDALVATGERVTVRRGEQKTVQLRVR